MVEFEIKPFIGNKIPGRRNEYVTHWAEPMPLPEPPKGEENETDIL